MINYKFSRFVRKSSTKVRKKPQKCNKHDALDAKKWHQKSVGKKLEKSWKISEVFRPKVGILVPFHSLDEKDSDGAG
jgi:hypothetical protein